MKFLDYLNHLISKGDRRPFETKYPENFTSRNDPSFLAPDKSAMDSAAAELDALAIKKNSDVNPLYNTSRVSIELSNLCNYAVFHKKCPVSLEKGHKILPSKCVYHVIDTLEKFGFSGRIAFHTYNEPMIDPRLFTFIEYARRHCSQSDIYISTNGYYLNQTLAEEMTAAGVTSIHVSAYTPKDFERLSAIDIKIPFNVEKMVLMNEVQEIYQAPEINLSSACSAPLGEIIVTRDGDISLCCRDWQRRYKFGSLHEHTFEDILRQGRLQAVHERLIAGDRFLDICKRCPWSR